MSISFNSFFLLLDEIINNNALSIPLTQIINLSLINSKFNEANIQQ
jgi:hypothetical protein